MIYHENPILLGLLLGWGAAIPIGPINLEVIRRNLNFGTVYGVTFGLGACSADVTYVILLFLGALVILNHLIVLKLVSLIGAFILIWFGFSALRMKINLKDRSTEIIGTPWRQSTQGYFLTLLNPSTILFWSSVSAQIAAFTDKSLHAGLIIAMGVVLGTLSWVAGLNCFLHFSRRHLSEKIMQSFNYAGGIILLGFAAWCLWKVFV